ncbi:somatotropin [Synchiropus splendidus]|uniref:somatotropin n=1 Tax=Synchiropus splendidus TaxID=270530 RepID=UPI00237D6263|nr:somatotropin [Synchiropus splendidus]
MFSVFVLLPLICLGVSSQPLPEGQRLFTIAVSRAQHLHQLAQNLFSAFESSLQMEEQRQLSKIFPQDFCNSDYFISPTDKHEAQRSPVLKLLSVSYQLVESWEFPSRSLTPAVALRIQLSPKLSELKTGIHMLIRSNQEDADSFGETSLPHLAPYVNYYQNLGHEESLRRTYKLLACFKKDMHKVETYLNMSKCRLYLEANCTL